MEVEDKKGLLSDSLSSSSPSARSFYEEKKFTTVQCNVREKMSTRNNDNT
jgi:hypothetical protein